MIHISHLTPSLPPLQLNTSAQVNNTAMQHHTHNHTYLHTSHLYYYPFLSSYFFHSFGQAGWPRPFLSVTVTTQLVHFQNQVSVWFHPSCWSPNQSGSLSFTSCLYRWSPKNWLLNNSIIILSWVPLWFILYLLIPNKLASYPEMYLNSCFTIRYQHNRTTFKIALSDQFFDSLT
jgi:hypothetical protein